MKKKNNYDNSYRKPLCDVLKSSYHNVKENSFQINAIKRIANENTFTITTGHQLNLFTGPLYFFYKIIDTINICKKLASKYPQYNFIPVYWMASEDHDFNEINFFNLFGKKINWDRESGGALGDLNTHGLDELLKTLKSKITESENSKKLIDLFSNSYLKHDNLSDATRYLANQLFAEYGLVIVDGNHRVLKDEFAPFVQKELIEKKSVTIINQTTDRLEAIDYKKQVHPRDINLFYITKGVRERIIEEQGIYKINNTTLFFNKDEILVELKKFPERFSPNALLRPLYQEVLLPNLCYVGGGGELAYWFQLKDYFKSVEVTFPILLLRNSVLLVPQKVSNKLEKLKVPIEALFLDTFDLEKKHAQELSTLDIDFTSQRNYLQQQFKDLYVLAKETDISFLGAVAAQEKKQLNGLDKLEKRLLKAEKRKLKDQIDRLTTLQKYLFPEQKLQERTINFSEFYLDYGEKLIHHLKQEIEPLCHKFTILEL